jgi:hypothetical protein
MTIEVVRIRISEIDVLYSKLDAVELRYAANLLSYIDYMIEKTKLEEKINRLFKA